MVQERRIARQEAGPLPCPRCGSSNTKFCYFNNYNTAQPRHFCRDCHRYWTHGGALRNIPAPGEGGNTRKNKRRVGTGPSTSPGPTKLPRIQDEERGTEAAIMGGPALAPLGLPPQPPPQILFGEGIGLTDSGFSLRPTLSLFNQGIVGGLRGFQPFNSLMMTPPRPPPPLSLQLLNGLNMNQVMSVNAGEGPSASGATDAKAREESAQDVNGGDLFVNQFFTRFVDGEGGETRAEFNAGADEANQVGGATTGAGTTTTTDAPPPPASFI